MLLGRFFMGFKCLLNVNSKKYPYKRTYQTLNTPQNEQLRHTPSPWARTLQILLADFDVLLIDFLREVQHVRGEERLPAGFEVGLSTVV